MATTQFYIAAGLPPDDNGADDGSTLFYITAGLVPDDVAAGEGRTTRNTRAWPLGVAHGMGFGMRKAA